jgi:hypothetical protein
MKTLPFIFALLLVLFLSNCSKDNELTGDSTFKLNDTLELAIDKSAINNEEQLTISIDSVLSDSRCPSDAICVWEGNAEVRFLLNNDGKKTKFILNSHGGDNYPSDTVIAGYNIELVALRPYPVSTSKISNSEYVADLLIKKE